jgi:hypothetical protein
MKYSRSLALIRGWFFFRESRIFQTALKSKQPERVASRGPRYNQTMFRFKSKPSGLRTLQLKLHTLTGGAAAPMSSVNNVFLAPLSFEV